MLACLTKVSVPMENYRYYGGQFENLQSTVPLLYYNGYWVIMATLYICMTRFLWQL